METTSLHVDTDLHCYHCGDACGKGPVFSHEHAFCCEGCKLVYELLSENGLCTYYDLGSTPGIKNKEDQHTGIYAALDEPSVMARIVRFENEKIRRITFRVPLMHCTSCIYLLEHLHKLDPGIISSTVNFLRKEVSLDLDKKSTSPGKAATLLASIGYAPSLSLDDLSEKKKKRSINPAVLKIGIAGFCFGNIMMLSFPDYLTSGDLAETPQLKSFFAWLSLALSLPVLFYSASGFFISAWKTIRYRTLNIDAPIALALVVTFARSVYEITFTDGTGYLDSMSGIVFFLLLGRYFQDRTYDDLTFDRDYRSYFPIAVDTVRDGEQKAVPVSELRKGDEIIIRGGELIPSDAILVSEEAIVDYSFVSGESDPSRILKGERIFAGAKQLSGSIRLIVERETSQSYLTQLWNNDAFSRARTLRSKSYVDRINRWFSLAVLLTALAAGVTWLFIDPHRSLNAMTAVLIVVCPCTLLLASTFTNGNVLRWMGREKFYLKNPSVIEKIATADTIIFDKTGTITVADGGMQYEGEKLSGEECSAVRTLASQSGHVLSRRIEKHFSHHPFKPVELVNESVGKGISGRIDGRNLVLGSASFAKAGENVRKSSEVWLAIDGKVKGKFIVQNHQRSGFGENMSVLKEKYDVHLLSGDNGSQQEELRRHFDGKMRFNFSPEEKLQYIRSLQEQGHRVIMIGDGLNDAGALMQADAGIAVSDNMNNYFPACDAILDGEKFRKLPALLSFAHVANRVVTASFIISILYNICGTWFAVRGEMSPLIAAILMPASSISMILLTTISTRIAALHLK